MGRWVGHRSEKVVSNSKRLRELHELLDTFEKNFFEFYELGWSRAAIRIRKNMRTLQAAAEDIFTEVQRIRKEAHQINIAEGIGTEYLKRREAQTPPPTSPTIDSPPNSSPPAE